MLLYNFFYTFSETQYLYEHRIERFFPENVNEKYPYACEQCEKRFARKDCLQKHTKLHLGSLDFI